jgi:hypothetical protein
LVPTNREETTWLVSQLHHCPVVVADHSAQSSVIALMLYGMCFFSHLMCFVLAKCWTFIKVQFHVGACCCGCCVLSLVILVRTFEILRSAITFVPVSIFLVSLHRCPIVSEMQILLTPTKAQTPSYKRSPFASELSYCAHLHCHCNSALTARPPCCCY